MAVDRVNQLNRAFTVIFTEAMQNIKPLQDIEKLRKAKRTDSEVLVKLKIIKSEQTKLTKNYDDNYEKWQSAFAFGLDLRKYINKLNNILVLAGGSNSSVGENPFTVTSLKILKNFMKSDGIKKSFEEHMESCAPKDDISNYKEKLEIWNKEFDFPLKLNEFIDKLKGEVENNKQISADDYMIEIDSFIKKLVNQDEFLIKETNNIGGEEYTVNLDVVADRAEKETNDLEKEICANIKDRNKPASKVTQKIKNNFSNDKKIFNKIMKDAKENQFKVKANSMIIEKKYDKISLNFDMDAELVKTGINATKKLFPKAMNIIAGASIIAILGLVIMSVLCLGCTFENSSKEIYAIYNDKPIDIFGIDIPVLEGFNGNPYTKLLDSNVVLILVSTIVAPLITKILKEKFDIDVTEKQVSMIVNDGIKSVNMYAKEADKLRDADGHIPRKYQKTLRDKAFNSLRENYDDKKYKELTANVGAQIFDLAIEHAVQSGKIKRFPLEKKQVEELIKQCIDAVPQIIEWQTLDEKAKNIFIDGNIRKLLQNMGINGWSYKALENIFDVETNKRLVGAALIVKDYILQEINSKNPYLKYTSTAIDAILEREKPKIVLGVIG